MTLKEFLGTTRQQRAECSREMAKIAKLATECAIEAAMDKTPPTGDVRGTNTRTGELKAHWATDSITDPKKRGRELVTELINTVQYASYVNDGHRMDRHFVPGLYINPFSGLLEYDESKRGEVGIMVGTKTEYVPGLFMAEAGDEAYNRAVKNLSKKLEDIIK